MVSSNSLSGNNKAYAGSVFLRRHELFEWIKAKRYARPSVCDFHTDGAL